MNMKIQQGLSRLIAGISLLLVASGAAAQWELDNANSTLNFISIKNAGVAESHRFNTLFGFIGKDGAVQLSVDLDSVDTAIEARNERMRELLFQTLEFPSAKVTAQVDPDIFPALAPGAVVTTDIDVTLSLHGVEATVAAPVVVISESDGSLRVITSRPILLQARDFKLGRGVAALQEAAGLGSISTAVPVSFHLVFQPATES